MKQTILISLLFFFAFAGSAQQPKNLFQELTETYASKDGFSASMLSSDMFDLYLKKRNLDETSPVSEALKKLDFIMVVSQSNLMAKIAPTTAESKENENPLHKRMLDYYQKNNYTLFKTKNRMGEDVKVYLKKNQDKIESLALITSSSASTNLVELKGDIDLKTVADLNSALNMRGLENLNKLNGSSAYGFYPGTGYSPEKIEEMVARQREQFEKQRNLTEEQRMVIEERARAQAEKQMQMAEKYREMAEKYQREPIFLNYPGDTNSVYFINGKKAKAKEIKELDKEQIESIEITKPKKTNDKTTIKIKTK
jgi:hypothetical protein